jgi:hypothetical protein
MMTNEIYLKIGDEFDALFDAYMVEASNRTTLGQDGLNRLRAEFVIKQDAMFAKYGTTFEEFEAFLDARLFGDHS